MRLTKRARRRVIFLLVLAVAGTAAVLIVSSVQQAQRERMREEERELGLAAFERGDMQATLDHLNVAVQYDKDDLDVLLAFAEARSAIPMPNRAHLHEARVYYDEALKLAEADPELEDRDAVIRDILTKLLHVRGMVGERVEMERIAERLLADHPANIEALTAKLSACIADRRFDEAMPIAEKLAELEPGTVRWPHMQLEIMRSTRALDAEIVARCDEWIANFEGDGRMHLLKAAWLYELGYIDRAQRVIETAVERGADSLEVLNQSLDLLGLMGRHDLVASLIDQIDSRSDDLPWARQAVIQYLWRSGRIADAAMELERASESGREFPVELKRDRVLVELAAGRISAAREALDAYRVAVADVATLGDDDRARNAELLALEARLARRGERSWAERLERIDEALAIAPEQPVVHFLRGEMLAGAGEHARASGSFARAAALDPTWVAASVAHADALLALGRFEEAFDVARSTSQRAPGSNLTPVLALARAAIQLNRTPTGSDDGARPSFESEERFAIASARRAAAGMDVVGLMLAVHERLPTHPQAFSLLFEALMQAGRADEAAQHMQAWLHRPQPTVDQLVVAAELVRRFDLGSADLLERRLREYRGDDARVAMAHAWLLADQGDEAAGLEVVERYFAAAPAEVAQRDTAQLARVSFYLSIGQVSEADSTGRAAGDEMLRELVDRYPGSVPVQSFALGWADVWNSQALVERIIRNLAEALGDAAQQVRLARASYLLRYFGDVQEERARAVATLQDVLDETPTSLTALRLLAEAYLKRPDGMAMEAQAIEALKTAVDTHPREISLYPRLIALLQQRGRYDEAKRYLASLGRLDASDPELARAEVSLLLTQGDFERALLRASVFMTEASPPSDVLLLAVMHDRTGDAAKARELFERLIADPEADSTVRTQAAEFFARRGEFDRGYGLLTQVLNEDVTEGEREVLLGWYCYRHGEPSLARTHFETAVNVARDSADAWHALARFQLSAGQYDDAERTASRGIDAVDEDERLRVDLALAVAGKSEQPWRVSLSRLGLHSNDLAALLAALELAAAVRPGGSDEAGAAPTGEQLEAARALLEEHQRFLPGWYLAIALHANANRMSSATELSRSAMSRFPTRPEPAEWAVRLFMQSDRWNEALSAAEEWSARSSGNQVGPHCAIASAMLQLDRASSAATRLKPHAQVIVEARDERPEQAMVLVDTLLQAGEFEFLLSAAAPMLEDRAWRRRWAFAARTIDPSTTASVLMELEARALEAPDDAPDAVQERVLLAAEWQQLADRTGEQQWLERAGRLAEDVARHAEHPALAGTAEFVLATIDESRGDDASAEQRYRSVLDAQPNHALAMNNLAYLLHSREPGSAEALELARRAAALMPESPDVLDTLGVVLLGAGKPADAAAQLRTALEARPEDVDIALNLVDALVRLERLSEATRQLDSVRRTLRRLPGRGAAYDERMQKLHERIENGRDRGTTGPGE